MTNKKVALFSSINFFHDESYSDTKIKLCILHKLIKNEYNQEFIMGVFNKLLEVFITRNKYIKKVCISIFKDINHKIDEFEVCNVIRMFYQNDKEIHDLVLKFVKIFHKNFTNNNIALFYILKCGNRKLKREVLDKLAYKDYYNRLETINNSCHNKQEVNYIKEGANTSSVSYIVRILKTRNKEEVIAEMNKLISKSSDFRIRSIIKYFRDKLSGNKSNTDFKLIVPDGEVDTSLVLRINGFYRCKEYKEIRRAYKEKK